MSLHVYTKIGLKTHTKIVSNPNEVNWCDIGGQFFSYYIGHLNASRILKFFLNCKQNETMDTRLRFWDQLFDKILPSLNLKRLRFDNNFSMQGLF
jgi:hypothetical protein